MTIYPLCSYTFQKQKDPSKAHQLKLEVIVKALKWLEMDIDVDEVCVCFAAPSQFPSLYFVSVPFLIGYLIKYLVQFVGGVHNGHINIQKSGKRILCTQE